MTIGITDELARLQVGEFVLADSQVRTTDNDGQRVSLATALGALRTAIADAGSGGGGTGTAGPRGYRGWSPVITAARSGDDAYIHIRYVGDGDAADKPADGFLTADGSRTEDQSQALSFRGPQGVQGAAGKDGRDGEDGTKGDPGDRGPPGPILVAALVLINGRIVQRIESVIGGDGTEGVIGMFVGATGLVASATDAVDLRGPKGDPGDPGARGATGARGPTPRLRTRINGDEIYIEVYAYNPAAPTEPTGFLAATGIDPNIANATNIRGPVGPQGERGEDGTGTGGGISRETVESLITAALGAYIGQSERAITGTYPNAEWSMTRTPQGHAGEEVLATLTSAPVALTSTERDNLAGGARITVSFSATYLANTSGAGPHNRLGVEFLDGEGAGLGYIGQPVAAESAFGDYSAVAPAGTVSFRVQLRGWTAGNSASGRAQITALKVAELGTHEREVEALIRRIAAEVIADATRRIDELTTAQQALTTQTNTNTAAITTNTKAISDLNAEAVLNILRHATQIRGVSTSVSRTGANSLVVAAAVSDDAGTEPVRLVGLLNGAYTALASITPHDTSDLTRDTFAIAGQRFPVNLTGVRSLIHYAWDSDEFTDELLDIARSRVMGQGARGATWSGASSTQTLSDTTTQTLATDGANLYHLVLESHAHATDPQTTIEVIGNYTRPTQPGAGALTLNYTLDINGVRFAAHNEPMPAASTGLETITLSETIGTTTYQQTFQRQVTIAGNAITVKLILPAETAPVGNPGDPTAPPRPIEHRALSFWLTYPMTTTRTITNEINREEIRGIDDSVIRIGNRINRFTLALSAEGAIEDAYLNGVRCRLPTVDITIPAIIDSIGFSAGTQYKHIIAIRGNLPAADLHNGTFYIPRGQNDAFQNFAGFISRTVAGYTGLSIRVGDQILELIPRPTTAGQVPVATTELNWAPQQWRPPLRYQQPLATNTYTAESYEREVVIEIQWVAHEFTTTNPGYFYITVPLAAIVSANKLMVTDTHNPNAPEVYRAVGVLARALGSNRYSISASGNNATVTALWFR